MINIANCNNAQIFRNNTDDNNPTLFLSYCQKDSEIANIIENQLKHETNDYIKISRFTRVPYKGSFKVFMNSIQEHNFVLCIVSDNYLKSQACMYEVGEVIKDRHFDEKLLFVVIGENDDKYYSDDVDNFAPAKIYGNEKNRLKYLLYWKNEYEDLKKELEKINDPEASYHSSEQLREIGKIYRNDISDFLSYLNQNNGKSFEELYNNRFFDIIKWICPNWELKVFSECNNMSELLTKAIKDIYNIAQTDYNQIALCVSVSDYKTGLVVYADNVSDKKQRYRLVVMGGVMAYAFSTGNIINIGNTKNESQYLNEADNKKEPRYFNAVEGTKSELVVPIVLQGKIIGVINSESEKEEYYSQEIVNNISCISQGLSIAIKRFGFIANMKADEIPYIHI